jgi:hypothetical protein
MENMKRCSKCGETKPLSAFYRDRNLKDGHACYCKTCSAARHRAWRLANLERLSAYQRDYCARRRAEKAEHEQQHGELVAASLKEVKA